MGHDIEEEPFSLNAVSSGNVFIVFYREIQSICQPKKLHKFKAVNNLNIFVIPGIKSVSHVEYFLNVDLILYLIY